jgi:hypothetical protein
MASVSLTPFLSRIKSKLELRADGQTITLRQFVSTWARWFWLRARVATARRSLSAQCPACGHRTAHKIRWEPDIRRPDGSVGAVIHTCSICIAKWSDAPIVASKHWLIAGALDDPQLPNHESIPPLEVLG